MAPLPVRVHPFTVTLAKLLRDASTEREHLDALEAMRIWMGATGDGPKEDTDR